MAVCRGWRRRRGLLDAREGGTHGVLIAFTFEHKFWTVGGDEVNTRASETEHQDRVVLSIADFSF